MIYADLVAMAEWVLQAWVQVRIWTQTFFHSKSTSVQAWVRIPYLTKIPPLPESGNVSHIYVALNVITFL